MKTRRCVGRHRLSALGIPFPGERRPWMSVRLAPAGWLRLNLPPAGGPPLHAQRLSWPPLPPFDAIALPPARQRIIRRIAEADAALLGAVERPFVIVVARPRLGQVAVETRVL